MKKVVVAFACLLAALIAVPAIAQAQRPPVGGPPPFGGPPAPVAPTGTAVIRGRIVAGDSGRPLRRALVTVTALDGNDRHTISTNADGRYEIGELHAGRYTVAASCSGYLTLRYGQSRPLELGKPLQLLDKQTLDKVDFTLPRMSVIAGRVTDEVGEAISGARVLVMRPSFVGGRRRLAVVDHTTTDDAGQYRIVNLPPASYYILATLRQTWTVIEQNVEQTIGYSPTYFPGTSTQQIAGRVTLGVGQMADATNFSMARGRVASISGTAVASNGRSLAGETVNLSQEFPNGGTNAAFQFAGSQVDADGTFAIRDVPPGDYKLTMRYVVREPGGGGHVEEAGVLPVSLNGSDARVTFTASRGGTVNGQVLTDRGTVPDIPRDAIRIVSRPLVEDGDLKVGGIDESGNVNDDGTFYVGGIFGRSRLRAILPDGWTLKAVRRDGRDVTDDPFELRSRETVSGFEVIVTDQVSTVTGQMVDDRNAPTSEGTVVVFHRDADKWTDASRYVRAVRPDQQGEFAVRGLPPGEYLAIALAYVEDGEWNDPEYLDALRRSAQRVRVGDGGTQAITLKRAMP